MSIYNIISSTNDCTVVAEYKPETKRSDSYQSEAQLEAEVIRLLQELGYEYLTITKESELVSNLRKQLSLLNNYTFSDDEWERFFNEFIARTGDGIIEKTNRIQNDYVQNLKRDDGTTKNITLIDKKNIHNNRLQVINQYENNEGKHDNRYDVTILVNGFPMIHIELKRRGVAIREAFNQIERYQRDSFWAGSGLYEYIQVFVISNGTHTKYYSNTTRFNHIKEHTNGQKKKGKQTSNSFEFTSYWADANNKPITDIIDFTKTFFARGTILNILTRYCVFTAEQMLLVMRPYQIAAAERILTKINIANNYKKYGSVEGGGYIWHTTGSGKTLTSFKTAQLATQLDFVDKVLFVVDRKDLDYQTMKEYDKFEKGAANSNKSTKILQRQLENPNARIIITTIQKLDNFISRNKTHDIYSKKIVIIFDECHRSQFGSMHMNIIKRFDKYFIFGFTGTPIFAVNASKAGNVALRTTEQAFGERLHIYTIVDAINDGNVLPFKIDYVNTVKEKDNISDRDVSGIDIEKAMMDSERISNVVSYILDHFNAKTKRNNYYNFKGQKKNGFNSLFAVSSIPMAIKYYQEFKKQIKERNSDLVVATIYSFSENSATIEGIFDDESFDTDSLDQSSRDFLESAIIDYNLQFHTNYNTSSEEFQNYYKDLSQRMKDREVDITIVVNMFLTGFDATTLNTLWVDKNLKQHGLIQAFSRTNRILNSIKTFGNIVCFRNLEEEVDEAIALFGDKDAGGIILLKDFESYMKGYTDNKGVYHKGYIELIDELKENYPLIEIEDVLITDKQKVNFIKLFGSILRVRNILSTFDQFENETTISPRDMQDYQSIYIDTYDSLKKNKEGEKVIINEDLVFEMELIKQVEVNIDYILELIKKYHDSNCVDKTIIDSIVKAIDSSLQLRSKKQLIEQFVATINAHSNIDEDWKLYIENQKENDLVEIIKSERLKEDETRETVEDAFRDGALKTSGTTIDMLMPPISRFGGGNRQEIKERIIEKLLIFFDKYFGL